MGGRSSVKKEENSKTEPRGKKGTGLPEKEKKFERV